MPEQQRPSRRTIVKGAAWSAPVVTIAAAAPSLAASGTLRYQVVPAKTFTMEEAATPTARVALNATAIAVTVSAANFPLEAPVGGELAHPGLAVTITFTQDMIATIRTAPDMADATHLRFTNGWINFGTPGPTPVGVVACEVGAGQLTPIPATGDLNLVLTDAGRFVGPFISSSLTPGTYVASVDRIFGSLGGYRDGSWVGDYPAFGTSFTISQIASNDNSFATVTVF